MKPTFWVPREKLSFGLPLISPCIMCVQYCGGAQYRGGYSVPWWDIMINVGGYLEYCVGCSVPWGDTILCNLSTVRGYHDTCGGISSVPRECSVPWGTQITKDSPPPTVLMISPTVLNTVLLLRNRIFLFRLAVS